MMQACGGCAQDIVNQVPILLNPAMWIVALGLLTGVTSVLGSKKKGDK